MSRNTAARDPLVVPEGEHPTEVELVLNALGIESLSELARLVTIGREHDESIDRMTGMRYMEMRTVLGSTALLNVMVVFDADSPITDQDIEVAGNFARLAVLKLQREYP